MRKSLAMVGHEKTCNKDLRNIAAVKRLSVSFGWKDATFVVKENEVFCWTS